MVNGRESQIYPTLLINGFWINETGELEIVTRYTARLIRVRIKISGLTFIGYLFLFYD